LNTALIQLSLSDTEIGLYAALILLADRAGLSEQKLIMRTRARIAEALKAQIKNGHGETERIYPTLEEKINDLKALGRQHFTRLDWFRQNWNSLKFPPLFAELFDIPKCEEELQ
jgi:nuclear receptor subfamily 1 group D member 3